MSCQAKTEPKESDTNEHSTERKKIKDIPHFSLTHREDDKCKTRMKYKSM